MKLIVGLGNPGQKYSQIKHNLGFMVVEEYAQRCLPSIDYSKFWGSENKFKAEVGRLKTEDIILVKPQTYMNDSGKAISAVAEYFKIQPESIIVIHDELDLPLGKIQIKDGGGASGHHGVESVISCLGTDQFIRVRVGINPVLGEPEKFVLEPFSKAEQPAVKQVVKSAASAVEWILEKGLESAQNEFN